MKRKIKVAKIFKKIKEIENTFVIESKRVKVDDGRRLRNKDRITQRLDKIFHLLINRKMSAQEIAEELEIKNRTVINYLHRLKRNLKSKYVLDRNVECKYYIEMIK